ncbi:MAG: hypothetical protein LBB66_04070 [Desulfovibrio sp.]|jgi:hypothetical protein|nr:hypothetical protein [Desulfovibrio sp.]
MELTGITQSMPLMFRFPDREDGGSTPPAVQDTVSMTAFRPLDDEQAGTVFDDTLDRIAEDNAAALSVHGGLVPERVFALLGM